MGQITNKMTLDQEHTSATAAETGNPVFDYARRFRYYASRVQGILLQGGLLALLCGGLFSIFPALRTEWTNGLCWGGGAALLLGLLGGACWRSWLRAPFRARYGLSSSMPSALRSNEKG